MRLLLIFFIPCIACASFSVSPLNFKLNVKRGEYTGWVEVIHTGGSRPAAVELLMQNRILDLDGEVKDTVIPNREFVIYPSQILLYPGQTAKAQIIYRGKKIDSDMVYFLHARELPMPEGPENPDEIKAGVSVVINYNVLVVMETGKPGSLAFVSSKSLDSGKVELVMENRGSGRFSLENINLYVGKKKITDYTGKNNAVLPGQKRRFVFKHPKPLKADEVRFTK